MQRFWDKVKITNGCWIWQAYRDANGYGWFWLDGRLMTAHRACWIISGKPLAKRKDLHHTCPNVGCVNPAHMKLLSHRLHAVFHARMSRKPREYCKRGHRLRGSNLYLHKRSSGRVGRYCRTCRAVYDKKRKISLQIGG